MPTPIKEGRSQTVNNARELIALAPGRSVPERIESAAAALGLPLDRVRKYWYGLVRSIRPSEEELIRSCYESAKKLTEARQQYEKLYNEIMGANTAMAKLAPGPLVDNALSNEARAVAQSRLHKRRHGRVA
jgi:hypothetical protein